MKLKLYNTETRQKEVLSPEDGHVRMYTCGPTVYHYAHIGNYRTYVFEDLLRRTMKFFGMKVTQVMNLTDVDDKTIKGAIKNQVSLQEFTKPFKDAFFEDIKTLGIEPVEHYPAATEYIDEMIEIIQSLLDKEIAYKSSDGSIYYSIKKFPRYGCLSHLKLEDLQAGASERMESDEYDKDHISDFVLWKSYEAERDGNIFWESPFGPGRPGWHLECSAMAMKIFGKTIDLHIGGVDNIFPHHENEIAQSEAHSGCVFARHWTHSEHLIVDGKKMSKSLGNFYTLRNLLEKGYSGTQVRYMLLSTHYRTQLNFTFPGLDGVAHAIHRLNDFVQRLKGIKVDIPKTEEKSNLLQETEETFRSSLADDLNISAALAAIFDLVRDVNSLCDKKEFGIEDARETLEMIQRFNTVLNVISFEEDEAVPPELEEALEKRIQARKDKNWEQADQLRDFIQSRGYQIEDTADGCRLKKQEV